MYNDKQKRKKNTKLSKRGDKIWLWKYVQWDIENTRENLKFNWEFEILAGAMLPFL